MEYELLNITELETKHNQTLESISEDGVSIPETEKEEMKNTNILIKEGYVSELSSFEYMPQKFLGINTSLFGTTNLKLYPTIKNEDGEDIKVHPFIILKQKALDSSINYTDRIQAIRYMARIPYKDFIKHCIEASIGILEDDSIDPYEKFFFYANNDKYIKLEDNIVHALHPVYFKEARLKNYPLEVTLLAARYIFINYAYDSDDRMDVLEYILNIADDKNETVYARAECADMLANFGEGNEVFFGKKIMEELGTLYDESLHKTIYTNAQNVHSETIQESIIKIIRSLRKEFSNIKSVQTQKYTLEDIQKQLEDVMSKEEKRDLSPFFFRVMTDPSRYERLSLADILILVYYKIQTFSDDIKQTCIKRLFEEVKETDNTCTTGYLSRIINVLSGFVEGEEFSMRIDPKDELRSAVFARVHAKIRSLPDQLRNDILESVSGDDKSMFDEFIEYYSPEEELWNEYKEIMKEEDFKTIYNKCIEEYKAI